ncbi:MAG: hypothetical protein ACHREM_00305 [Polyangiales bacterium]
MRVVGAFLHPWQRKWIIDRAQRATFVLGRQGTGYEKFEVPADEALPLRARCLQQLGLAAGAPHDCYLIRYGVGASIPPHVDPAPEGQEHHRINCVATAAQGGALLVRHHPVALYSRDAYVFRPDLELHEVTLVTRGERLVFSLGTLLPTKPCEGST